jgi:drug/metabolite transporter (DMT)-like permease
MDCVEPIDAMDQAGQRKRAGRVRVVMVILFATLLVAVGEVFLSAGMKQVGKGGHDGFRMVLAALSNPLVWGGFVLSASFFGLYLLTLSWADISFVMPFTALSYFFVAVMAKHVLHEPVSMTRWIGTLLIVFGVMVVGFGERQ